MARSSFQDSYDQARETTLAAAAKFGEGYGQAAVRAQAANKNVTSFRQAVKDQPLVMSAVMLGVGYFLRTILYPNQNRRR